jgi:hypothetical protein
MRHPRLLRSKKFSILHAEVHQLGMVLVGTESAAAYSSSRQADAKARAYLCLLISQQANSQVTGPEE